MERTTIQDFSEVAKSPYEITVVEGSIGIGKSTLLKMAQGAWGLQGLTFMEEPVKEMERLGEVPNLQDFYKDMKKNARAFQFNVIKVLVDATEQALLGAKGSNGRAVVMDRCLFSPLAFTRVHVENGIMTRADYKEIKFQIMQHAEKLGAIPAKFILFEAPPRILIERICRRARKGEELITKDYLGKLARQLQWLAGFLARRYGTEIHRVAIKSTTKPEEMLHYLGAKLQLPQPLVALFERDAIGARAPVKANLGDVGFDLFAYNNVEIPAGARKVVYTGIALTPPQGYYFQIMGRSSLARMGMDVVGGVIDTGYTKGLSVIMVNNSGKDAVVERSARIGQAVPLRCAVELALREMVFCEARVSSARGDRGFGSSTGPGSPTVRFK